MRIALAAWIAGWMLVACGPNSGGDDAGGHGDGGGNGMDVAGDGAGGMDVANGGDGDNAGDGAARPDVMQCPGTGATLSGTVLSPDGADPIFGALVYVIAGEPAPIAPGVGCDTCELPRDVLGFDTTGADGAFAIPHALDAGGALTVVIEKGRFRRVLHLNAAACAPQTLTMAQTSLPGASGTDVTLPKILVATNVNDDIGTVLTRIGITEFDMMDGCRRATTADEILACPFGQLLADPMRLAQYNIVFAPCGALGDFKTWQLLPPSIATNLQTWLAAGGRLYASDLSYGVIQKAAPDAFVFPGGTTLSQNGNDPADLGVGGSRATPASYEGVIDDPDLHAWMNGRGALLANGDVQLDEFLNPWGAVDHAGPIARTWVHGSVRWRDASGTQQPAADHPLTLESEYRGMDGRGCGRVVFTSYHTTSMASGMLTPQERVLEWLIFELGGCTTPG